MAPNWDTYPNTHGLTQVLGMSHSIASVFNITEGSFPVERNPTFNCFCKEKKFQADAIQLICFVPEAELLVYLLQSYFYLDTGVCLLLTTSRLRIDLPPPGRPRAGLKS